MRNGYRHQEETFVPELDAFQPFDVRALAHLHHVKNDFSKLPTNHTPSLRAQVAS
jgi:hypothetical protein